MKKIYLPQHFPLQGSSYGFSKAQANIEKALLLNGVDICYSANIELVHCSSHLYTRKKKKSILWFPYEANRVPRKLIDKANEADLIIASCEDNKKAFIESGVYKSIEVCPLSIDTDLYTYQERVFKEGSTFKFLWLGQNNIRKGWDLVSEAFSKEFTVNDNVHLYLKTSSINGLLEKMEIGHRGIVDSRNLAEADLLDLYYDSHAFIFPTRGEGTGLPAMEAMATGCLIVAPNIQGLKSFVNKDTAVVLDYDYIPGNYGVNVDVPNVNIKTLKKSMRIVYNRFHKYRELVNQGSHLIHNEFNLKLLGERLIDIIWRI